MYCVGDSCIGMLYINIVDFRLFVNAIEQFAHVIFRHNYYVWSV